MYTCIFTYKHDKVCCIVILLCCCIVILLCCHIGLLCCIVMLLCCCIVILSCCHIVLSCCIVILLCFVLWYCCVVILFCRVDNVLIRLYLWAFFLTARLPTARLVRQSLWQDVTVLGLQCWNTQAVDVTWKRGFYAQTAPLTPSVSKILFPRLSPPALTQCHCLLLLPPALSIDAIAAPPLAAAIANPIATMERAMPCCQLTGCIHRGKKSKMSVANALQRSWKDGCLFMTAMFYVVIQAHSHLWRSVLSLQGFKVLFQCRIFSRPTARKNWFLRAFGVIFLTDRTHFWDRTQKTDQTDWGWRSQLPDTIQNSVRSVSVRSDNRPVNTVYCYFLLPNISGHAWVHNGTEKMLACRT